MFKPHVTVACIVHANNKFLVVEETVNGKATWNQPAGHLEANETLIQAAQRELWEETGLTLPVQYFLKLHQWVAPDNTPFLRFLFLIEAPEQLATQPHDDDINGCYWVRGSLRETTSLWDSSVSTESRRLRAESRRSR